MKHFDESSDFHEAKLDEQLKQLEQGSHQAGDQATRRTYERLRALYTPAREHEEHAIERVRARLAQRETSVRASLSMPGKQLEGKGYRIQKKNIMEEKQVLWGTNSSQLQAKKRGSLTRTIGISIAAAVAIITILSFTLFSSTQQAGHGSSTLVGAVDQQQNKISRVRQVCSFTAGSTMTDGIPWKPILDWSTQGQIAVAGYKSLQVVSAKNCAVPLSLPLQQNYGTRWSPDGSKMLTLSPANTLDVLDRQGHLIARLPFSQLGADAIGEPLWSSDGTKIFFLSLSNPTNQQSMKSVNIAGNRNVTTMMTLPPTNGFAAISPNGKFILTVQTVTATHRATGFSIWNLNTKRQISTLPVLAGTPIFSPDGSRLAVAGPNHIDIYATANGKLVSSFSSLSQINNTLLNFAWSLDGKYLAESTHVITIYDVQAKKAVATFGQVDEQHVITMLAWSPDSKGLVSATAPIDNSSPEATVHVWSLS